MGWWDYGVFGGDTALDAVYELGQLIGLPDDASLYPLERWGSAFLAAVQQALLTYSDLLVSTMAEYFETKDYGTIFAQVVGAVWMATGLPMPDTLRMAVLWGCEYDEWMHEEGAESERGRTITAFMEQVKTYDASGRVITASRGLLERMSNIVAGNG